MPTDDNGVLRYDINDPADLADLIASGLIWKAGPTAIAKAIQAIQSGAVPMPTRNVPTNVQKVLDRMNLDPTGLVLGPNTKDGTAEWPAAGDTASE